MRKITGLEDGAFRTFFEASPQAMWVYDLADLRFLAVNRAASKQYGFSEEEFLSMTLLDVRAPEQRERLVAAMAKVRELHQSERPEVWEHRTKDGRTIKVEVLAATIRVGEAEAGFTVLHDVTEAFLQRENLAWAQQISHIGSWSYDMATARFTLSDEYYRITGYEPGGYEATWPSIIACVHPDDRHLVDRGSTRLNAATWSPQRLEVRMLRPNGEVRHVISSFDAEFASDGSPLSISGTIQDVTDRKQAEETQRWLAEIVSSSSDSIIGTTLEGVVLSWNRASELLFGYQAHEMIGQPLLKLIPAKRWTEASTLLTNLRNGQRIPEIETERIDKHGRVFDVSFIVSPVQTEDGRVIGAATISRDITARKQIERQLASKVAQLTALRKIDAEIAAADDLEGTLETVIEQTFAVTDAEAVCIFTTHSNGSGRGAFAARGRDGKPAAKEQLARAEMIASAAIAKRRITSSALAGSTFLGQDDHDRTGIACDARPLMAKGSIFGAMTVEYSTGVKRSADVFYFLDTLAGQTAVALESMGSGT